MTTVYPRVGGATSCAVSIVDFEMSLGLSPRGRGNPENELVE